jgi:type VI secretion system protein ImpI/type VI secretion system protein
MGAILAMTRCPDGVGAERRDVPGGELTIGRGNDCDWILPDPDKILSKQHCRIEARGDAWLVTDSSSNGTLLNGTSLESGLPHPLRDHDRLTLGSYEIEVRFEAPAPADPDDDPHVDPADAPTRFVRPPDLSDPQRLTGDPFPPEEDPLEAARPSVALPLDLDALMDAGDRIAEPSAPFPDQVSHLGSHFTPPRPSFDLLPEDWDQDDAAPEGAGPSELPRPVDRTEDDTPSTGPVPVRPSAAPDGHAGDTGLAAFLAGARVRGELPADPDAILRQLGAAFRAMVGGLRESMIARAAVKSEFRIGQTMIRPAGNNPLKFSADDDDALAALLGIGRQSAMRPEAAVADTLRDIRLHELATAAALQSAVRELLAEIAPERVMRSVRESAIDDLLGRRKQAAWDAYAARHAAVTRALGDDFDSVFGRAFARAYEIALAAVGRQEARHEADGDGPLDRGERSGRQT